MRYVRMLTNSLLAGALGAAFVCVLILQLNPQLRLSLPLIASLAPRVWVFYGLNLAVFFYALIVLAQLASRDGLSPGWLSLRLLAWSSTLVTSGAATLMWLNLRGFARVLPEEPTRRMAAGAAATSVCALLLLIIAIVHYSFGRRGSRVGGTLYALTVVAAISLPVSARGWGEPLSTPPPRTVVVPSIAADAGRRVVMVLLDGASLDFIAPITATGRLPHLDRLLDEGASMHLSTIRPTQPGPVWAAVATGVYPPRDGIRANDRYGFGLTGAEITLLPDLCFAQALATLGILETRPNDAEAFLARPVWRILSDVGIETGVVGLPFTHPAPALLGYVVSDRLHLQMSGALHFAIGDLVYPPELMAGLPDAVFELPSGAVRGSPPEVPWPRDVFYGRLARALDERRPARVRIVRYEGIDVAGHRYLRFALPGAFGDVTADERQRYGLVLEQAYAVIDAELGEIMETLGPDDLLMVVSGFGIEPQSPAKRMFGKLLREPSRPGTHESAPDGFLLLWGPSVARGRLPVGSVVDVVPTLLYFLGLPMGRDMDGVTRTDAFTPAFTSDRPVTYIPSYGR